MTGYRMISILLLLAAAQPGLARPVDGPDGREIMEEVYRRHKQYPYVYEQQSMVMRDRNGQRTTRKAQRYSRVEQDGTAHFLLVFDYPREINGVAVLASRSPSGEMTKSIYLPALGERLIESSGANAGSNFLGTDFSVENIVGEQLSDYHYVRRKDRTIDNTLFFVVDVYRPGDSPEAIPPLRRHFVRKDNFFISQTEHYDKHGRLHKKQTHHDLRAVDGDMWRSSMILMEDVKEQHQSLLKVTRRMFSHDYVPAEMFSAEWLFENHPYIEPPSTEEKDAEDEQMMPISSEESEEL